MFSVRATLKLVAVSALAFATSFAFAPAAGAQTMGEYGGVVSNGAASASAMPAIRPPNFGSDFRSSSGGGSSGSSQTVEIRGGGRSDAAERPRVRAHAKDTDQNDDSDDWVQVR